MAIREERTYCTIFKRTEQEKRAAGVVNELDSTKKELEQTKKMLESLVEEVRELRKYVK